MINEIHDYLMAHQDLPYAELQRRTIPTLSPDMIIGVRTPILRTYAKEIARREDIGEFLACLPHASFEENQLHAFVISLGKDYEHCVAEVNRFLPYVDNWATCDCTNPKVLGRCKDKLVSHIDRWIATGKTYYIRYAIKLLMTHFLDEDYSIDYMYKVAEVTSDEYYVNMMIAWYFATALAKQYESVLPFIEEKRLDDWTHNKAIQKSIESRRITVEQKQYLKSLKI